MFYRCEAFQFLKLNFWRIFVSEEFLSWTLQGLGMTIFSNYKRKNPKMTTICIIPQIFGSEFHNAQTQLNIVFGFEKPKIQFQDQKYFNCGT